MNSEIIQINDQGYEIWPTPTNDNNTCLIHAACSSHGMNLSHAEAVSIRKKIKHKVTRKIEACRNAIGKKNYHEIRGLFGKHEWRAFFAIGNTSCPVFDKSQHNPEQYKTTFQNALKKVETENSLHANSELADGYLYYIAKLLGRHVILHRESDIVIPDKRLRKCIRMRLD